MSAHNFLNDMRESGLNFSLVGDTLRVVPRAAITPELRATIREHRAALVELLRQGVPIPAAPEATQQAVHPLVGQHSPQAVPGDATLPPEWSAGLLRLQTIPRPSDIDQRRWQAIKGAAVAFERDGWAVRAHAAGWTIEQTFGCHRVAPSKRFDHQGLLWAMSDPGVTLVELTADQAVFEVGRNRVRQKLRRAMIFSSETRLIFQEQLS
ncbi:MAG: hypothetical protein HQL88_10190 [Magnetococcales bacterium]|nr:hypothetical protein [Magnetococcales bacterium]